MNFIEQISLEHSLIKETHADRLIHVGLQFDYEKKIIYTVRENSSFILQDNETTLSIKAWDSQDRHSYIPLLYRESGTKKWVTSAAFTKARIRPYIKEFFIANAVQSRSGLPKGWVEKPDDFIWVENTLMANLSHKPNGILVPCGSAIYASSDRNNWRFPLELDYNNPWNYSPFSVEDRIREMAFINKLPSLNQKYKRRIL